MISVALWFIFVIIFLVAAVHYQNKFQWFGDDPGWITVTAWSLFIVGVIVGSGLLIAHPLWLR